MSENARPAAVAGMFYPAQADALRTAVDNLLAGAPSDGPGPKAIIVPHAGYRYSGAVAAAAYAQLAARRAEIKQVILLGPAHRVPLQGLAASSAGSFATPLGEVSIAQPAQAAALALPQVQVWDAAHVEEHSLEVQLPFLQRLFSDVAIVPLVVGEATMDEVAEVLDALWGGPETAVVISSDLSHFHDYATACNLDEATAAAIVTLNGAALGPGSACGRHAIRGLLKVARERGLTARTVLLRNSGDSGGPRDRVVGYGAFVFR
jgi:AmmeMemoRadiSam system protein B